MPLYRPEAQPRSAEVTKKPDRLQAQDSWKIICQTLNPTPENPQPPRTTGEFVDQIKLLAVNLPALSHGERNTVKRDFKNLKRNAPDFIASQLKPALLEQITSHSGNQKRNEDLETAKLLGLIDDKDISKALGADSKGKRNAIFGTAATILLAATTADRKFAPPEVPVKPTATPDSKPSTPKPITEVKKPDSSPPSPNPFASPTHRPSTPSPASSPTSESQRAAKPTEVPKPTAVPDTADTGKSPDTSHEDADAEHNQSPETKKINIVEEILRPLNEYALKQRQIRAESDPEHDIRVEKELNENRVNFLLYGYGEEHGESYEDYGGSITMLSVDSRTGQIASFSLSRDILTPELRETATAHTGIDAPRPIRRVFKTGMEIGGKEGGFDLTRQIAERATGLSADFQVVLKDTVIRDLIRDITGPLDVNVDKEHHTATYRLDRTEQPEGYIAEGEQVMDAEKAMQFILAEDKEPVGKKDERSYRKNILMRAMKNKLSHMVKKDTLKNVLLPKNLLDFFNKHLESGDIELDFDPGLLSLAMNGVGSALWEITKSIGRKEIVIPEDNISIEASIHDPFFGDGSVRRVHNIKAGSGNPNIPDNPTVVEVAKTEFMPPWMLVAEGGNPYSDNLIEDYWGSIRKLIRSKLIP